GEPEFGPAGFGLDDSSAPLSAGAMVVLFGIESLYHLDNHLALCALILLPRLLLQARWADAAVEDGVTGADLAAPGRPAPSVAAPSTPAAPAFLGRFDPPVKGHLL